MAIEPDRIERPGQWKEGAPASNVTPQGYNRNLFRRMMGYDRDPATCLHHKKFFTVSANQWRCKECGEWL